MNRNHLLLAAVGLASMLAGVALFHVMQSNEPVASAEPPPSIELHSIPLSKLDGQQSVLSDWNNRILVINFWAPWCAPCRREIPALIEIQREYAARDLLILGLAFDFEPSVREFAAEYDINYPLFLVEGRSSMYNAAFSNPSGSLPYTAILGPERNIRFQHNGELSADQLREQIERQFQSPG